MPTAEAIDAQLHQRKFMCRYHKHAVDDVRQLSKEDQQMASFLREAEEQGLLEVYLAQIDLEYDSSAADSWCTRNYTLGIKDRHTQINSWRRLNGSDPGWKHTLIMQADMQWEVRPESCNIICLQHACSIVKQLSVAVASLQCSAARMTM